MENKNLSRRSFVKKSALGAGAIGFVNPVVAENLPVERLPREVVIASFCAEGLEADTPEHMLDILEGKLQTVFPLQPDIICTPEIFPFFWKVKKKLTVPEQAEFSKKALKRLSALAARNNCYIICSLVTQWADKYYNAAVLLDREGKYVGEYQKIHATEEEMKDGISPAGPIDPPVFETDFGKIGIQICFDVRWDDGWNVLQEKGAEIIFWPSAFPGGKLLQARALRHHAVIVSSTLKTNSKIIDIDGSEIASTGRWQEFWTCGTINLERAFLHSWPYVLKFDEVQKKYGRKIRIQHLFDEGNSIIESLSPDVKIADVMKEFGFKTISEHLAQAESAQHKKRSWSYEG